MLLHVKDQIHLPLPPSAKWDCLRGKVSLSVEKLKQSEMLTNFCSIGQYINALVLGLSIAPRKMSVLIKPLKDG